MRATYSRMRHQLIVLCLLSLALPHMALAKPNRAPDKMKPEEVVAKHLEAIGTAEARAKIKSRIIQGTVIAAIRVSGAGQALGGSVLASQGEKSLISIVYTNTLYRYERAGFDGKTLTLSEVTPGVRSTLGKFLQAHEMLFREGLLGGTLSSAWPLLDMAAHNTAKLRYVGMKKVGERKAHVLEYDTKNNTGLKTLLYFDAETFQHLRSEYEQRIAQQMPNRPSVTQEQGDAISRIVEDFSDYSSEGGLMLPHTYKLQLSIESLNLRVLQDWTFTLSKFSFNIPIADSEFNVSTSNKAASGK